MAVVVLLMAGACGGAASSASAPHLSTEPTSAPPSPAMLRTVRAAAIRTLGLGATVSLEFAGPTAAPIRGQGSFDFGSGTGLVVLEQTSGRETLEFAPTFAYDRPPAQTGAGLPQGKHWIAAEPTEHLATASSFGQAVVQLEGKNPSFLLSQVAWGATSAAPIASQSINGQPASGYLARIDISTAAAGAKGPSAHAFAAALNDEQTGLGATTQSPAAAQAVRVWVDAAGRIVRLQASPEGSGIGTTVVTLTSFGQHAAPPRPPKDQTVDLATLTPGSGDVDRD